MKKHLFYSLLSLSLLLAWSCKKDKPLTLKIGDKYKGGVVAYILQPGDAGYNSKIQHGIISAEENQYR